ncbi:MAG: aminotransferase class I/II-fold pyridoxal phosphate-dependent enzyme, partial [Planctomycetota bacterium]
DRFVSPAEVYDRTVSVYSFGKYLMVQGQRIGYLAVSPSMFDAASVAEDYTKWCRIMGFCTPTALMQQAVPHLLGVKTDLTPVRRRREVLIEAMSAAGYELSPSDATFFLYAAAPGGDDFAFTERLAERGTLVLPSSLFHHRGYFRLSVTGSEQMVAQALTALREVRT